MHKKKIVIAITIGVLGLGYLALDNNSTEQTRLSSGKSQMEPKIPQLPKERAWELPIARPKRAPSKTNHKRQVLLDRLSKDPRNLTKEDFVALAGGIEPKPARRSRKIVGKKAYNFQKTRQMFIEAAKELNIPDLADRFPVDPPDSY